MTLQKNVTAPWPTNLWPRQASRYPGGQPRFRELEQQFVRKREVAVDPFLQRFHLPAVQVRFKRVARAGGRDCPERRRVAVPF